MYRWLFRCILERFLYINLPYDFLIGHLQCIFGYT